MKQEDTFSVKEKLLYSLAGLVLFGGSIFMGRRLIKKAVSTHEEKSSLTEEAPATWAKLIKLAFENDGWPGTDTPKLRATLIEIPDKATFTKVLKSYQKLYNSNLLKDLSSELQTTEYQEMLSIISGKPSGKGSPLDVSKQYEAWAKRLKAAFDKEYGFLPGTDEEAIKAVFNEIPTQAAYVETGKAYNTLYHANFTDDLKSELELWEYGDYMKIITAKPRE